MQDNMDWKLNTSLCTAVSFPQTKWGGGGGGFKRPKKVRLNKKIVIYNCTAKTIPTANKVFVP